VSTPTERLLAARDLLCGTRWISASTVAAELGVSPRTARRYVATLRALGVPVESTRGPAGGYRLASEPSGTSGLHLDDDEAVAVAVALSALVEHPVADDEEGHPSPRTGRDRLAEAAERAAGKVEATLRPTVRHRVGALRRRLRLTRSVVRDAPAGEVLLGLASALEDGTAVRLRYTDAQGRVTDRDVDPHGLVVHRGHGYLAAWDHLRDDRRTFRLDRVVAVLATDRPVDLGHVVDARDQVVEALTVGAWRHDVEVVVHAPRAWVTDHLGPDRAMLGDHPDGTVVRVGENHLESAANLLASLPWTWEIVRPDALRDVVRDLGHRLVANAGGPLADDADWPVSADDPVPRPRGRPVAPASSVQGTMTDTLTATLTFPVTASTSPATDAEREAVLADPGFGKHFSDHLATATWTADDGWHDDEVRAYGPISLDPAAAVLHYAQEIFEGLKAYRHADGSIWSFRPDKNAARFSRSARRLALPELPDGAFVQSLVSLVGTDRAWVPTAEESSLYIRPFMIASETFLGVRPAQEVTYMVITSPVGAYFASGPAPVSIWLSRDYTRAARGGTGAAKCGGNYAASLAAQQQATEHGCQQVCFLDAIEGRWVEELGGMNLFFIQSDGTVVTPPLSGTILEGVTRESVITLARDAGHEVVERPVSIEEWIAGAESGDITEVFACGTAAVITPLGTLQDGDRTLTMGDGTSAGEVTMAIRRQLVDIQYGRADDPHGWMTQLV